MTPPPPRLNVNSLLGVLTLISVTGGWVWFAATKSAKIDSTSSAVEAMQRRLEGADIYKSAESEKHAAQIAALQARVEMLTNIVMSDRKLAAAAVKFSGPEPAQAADAAPPQ